MILQDYAAIGDNTNCYNVATITIGEYATVSQDSVLCTASHDSKQLHLPLLSSEIVIDSYAWICADTFIMPGVVVGRGAIVGARSTVFSDVAPWTIEGGSPSKEIRKRYLNPQQEILDLDKANYEQ
ncbi:MAG: putative colanic acid biosynthesis acetyltransferase [Hyphomicrobiales bacterium]